MDKPDSTKTPRTDAVAARFEAKLNLPREEVKEVAWRLVDLARQLERELAEAQRDVLTLCLRLFLEPTDSHSPDTLDVLERWRPEWEAAAGGERKEEQG